VNGHFHAPVALLPRYQLNRKLDGAHSLSGRCGDEEKKLRFRRESKPGRPAHSLVTVLTEQPWLLKLGMGTIFSAWPLWGSWGTAPRILNVGTRWRWVVSFAPRPLYPRQSLDRRLGGPQNRSGRGGEEKKIHYCPYQELNPGRPAHSLPTSVLNESSSSWCVQCD
jgi:hypothetical protein